MSLQANKTRKIAHCKFYLIEGPKLDLTGDDPEGRQKDGFSPNRLLIRGLCNWFSPIDIINTKLLTDLQYKKQ